MRNYLFKVWLVDGVWNGAFVMITCEYDLSGVLSGCFF